MPSFILFPRARIPFTSAPALTIAIAQAEEAELLGENILGSGFNFKLRIKQGAGAFVCGEETALIASIEGKQGRPRPRPPFPAQSGLWGKPTNINNVETWANIPPMKEKNMGFWEGETCEYCSGPIVEKRVTLHRKVKGDYVLIKSVPAGVCTQCGTRYYAANVLKTIEESIRGRRKAEREVLVPVYSL